jgi:hypothetical protein
VSPTISVKYARGSKLPTSGWVSTIASAEASEAEVKECRRRYHQILRTIMQLSSETRAVLARCEKTASWYGIRISSVDQRNHLNDTPLHTVCSWGNWTPYDAW